MSDAVLIIQARLGSTRFPRKMLAPLGGKPIIEWVVERVLRSRFAADVVVATTDLANDDDLVTAMASYPVRVHRGPSEDVLARFAGAAATSGAPHVVRICADNPFVDSECIDVLVAEHIRRGTGYTFNHRPFDGCDYADGLGAEIVERSLFDRLTREANEPRHREHVTLALVDGTMPTSMCGLSAPAELRHPEIRLDVDTPEDLRKMETIVELGTLTTLSSAGDVVAAALAMA